MRSTFNLFALGCGVFFFSAGVLNAKNSDSFGNETSFLAYNEKGIAKSDEPRKKAKMIRPYWIETSQEQIDGIRFIVLTLGKEPLLKLKKLENDLNRAADKFERVHPLNVWRIIFSNNETISALHNIKNRKLIWKKFMKGMGESFDEARDFNDLKDEYIHDFANRLSLSEPEIKKLLVSENWNGFVEYLLASFKAPQETSGKYNQ